MPPVNKKKVRDLQICSLLGEYEEVARVALGVPFSIEGAKNARCLVIGALYDTTREAIVDNLRL